MGEYLFGDRVTKTGGWDASLGTFRNFRLIIAGLNDSSFKDHGGRWPVVRGLLVAFQAGDGA